MLFSHFNLQQLPEGIQFIKSEVPLGEDKHPISSKIQQKQVFCFKGTLDVLIKVINIAALSLSNPDALSVNSHMELLIRLFFPVLCRFFDITRGKIPNRRNEKNRENKPSDK